MNLLMIQPKLYADSFIMIERHVQYPSDLEYRDSQLRSYQNYIKQNGTIAKGKRCIIICKMDQQK